MRTELAKHNIVLLGAGHTNAHILRMSRMRPIADAQLICVNNLPLATYSGMLPGVLAGDYPQERMEIDLVRLCASVGARLVLDPLIGVDINERQLHFDGRPPLPFDLLSVGVGSAPDMTGVDLLESDNIVPIKPMQTFLTRLETAVRSKIPEGRPLSVAVVGGGLGGAEISFCLATRIEQWIGHRPFRQTLVTSGDVGAGLQPWAATTLRRELDAKHIELESGRRVERVEKGLLVYDNGERGAFDVVLWATSAVAPDVLQLFELPKDDRGFLLVDHTLRTVHHDAPVFAVGDSGTIQNENLPKAGVYAVRQGPVLLENMRAYLSDRPLQSYRPQRRFLKLINLGDKRAIGEYGPISLCNRWMWSLKDRIDGRFIDKYQAYEPPMMSMPSSTEAVMRCAGCGGKVGPSVLSRALARLQPDENEQVQVGLQQPDDVAFLNLDGEGPLAATVDFFPAPLDDPYLVGRVAALNAASDMFASGARAQAALTVATLPVGHPRAQEQTMFELLAGAMEEFRKSGTALVGGHTTEGSQLLLGFAMLGHTPASQPALLKAGAKTDDVLVLTKPLGVGVLLAAHMQAACRAEWWTPLLNNLLASNQGGAELLRSCGAHALTDITGFGLAGHLLEMLEAGSVSAELWLDRIPVLPGAIELARDGVESTLSPANRIAEQKIRVEETLRRREQYALLFDPQTSGGLLAALPPQAAESALERLAAAGVTGAIVGRITESADAVELRLLAAPEIRGGEIVS